MIPHMMDQFRQSLNGPAAAAEPRPVRGMARTPLPPILYLVVQDFGPGFGIGSGDATGDRDNAYDNFAAAVENGHPVAVWEIATHGGLPVSTKDATDTFERELQDVCIARDLDWPTVRRIEDAPAFIPIAAE